MGFEQERLSRLQLGFNGATLRREWNVRTCADADERGGGASMEPLSGESGMPPIMGPLPLTRKNYVCERLADLVATSENMSISGVSCD